MHKQSNASTYPVYHSVHDNIYWMEKFGDPNFSHHIATGLVWIKLALLLTTQPVLLFDPTYYGIVVTEIYENVEKEYGQVLMQHGISLRKFLCGINKL